MGLIRTAAILIGLFGAAYVAETYGSGWGVIAGYIVGRFISQFERTGDA